MNIGHWRHEYSNPPLSRSELPKSPFVLFGQWLKEAENLLEPNAMSLATVQDGQPSCRTVLLKHWDEEGFVFFTDARSRKAQEIAANPKTALTFFWREIEKQILIEGAVSEVSKEEAEAYFATRSRESRLAAIASHQDHELSSRQELEKAYDEVEKRYPSKIPTPPHWVGYRVKPNRFEFWQGQPHRLHDRFLYLFQDEKWDIKRLSP